MRTHRSPCRAFPAFTHGPPEFYARGVVAPPPRKRKAEEARPMLRARNRCREIPQVPAFDARFAAPTPRTKPSRFEEPLVIAAALALLPPVGVTLLWASPRFSGQAKAAITLFAAFAMLLAAACALVLTTRVCH